MKYPTQIADEFETMRKVAAGKSLARFGDGELKMMFGSSYVRQVGSIEIATELFNVMNAPAEECIVGIPTMDRRGPKVANWQRHIDRFERVIQRPGPFYSAFVTRPDSAPWIETPEYLDLVLSCWRGKSVVLVSEPTNKLIKILRATAGSLVHLECPSEGCYPLINQFELEVWLQRPQIAILSMGVTATCLANRLAARGVQALDFGSAGGMMARLFERQP